MVVNAKRAAAFGLLLAVASCGSPARPPDTSASSASSASSGRPLDLAAIAARAPVTVVTFFSAHCPCQRAHDVRLRELYAAYAPRGVQFVAVDVERGASAERERAESAARSYPFPLLAEPGGASADAMGAEFATYTVVLDHEGRVRYRGGIDSDRTHLTSESEPFVREALDDLLAGREVRVPEGKVLGCSLQR